MFEDNDTYQFQLQDLLCKLRSDDTITGNRKNETLDMMIRIIEQDRWCYDFMYKGDILEKSKELNIWDKLKERLNSL